MDEATKPVIKSVPLLKCRMGSLYSLAQRLQVGDKLQLKGERSDVTRQKPKQVTRVDCRPDEVRVEAEGPEGGQYAFTVDSDDNSKAIFIDPETGEEPQGSVELARLVWPGDREIST
jgi:hypothetical protein